MRAVDDAAAQDPGHESTLLLMLHATCSPCAAQHAAWHYFFIFLGGGEKNVTRRHIRHTSMALPTGMELAETLRWGKPRRVTPPTPVDNHSEHNAGAVSVSAAKSAHQPIQKWGIDS
jgi:hypothetical protein